MTYLPKNFANVDNIQCHVAYMADGTVYKRQVLKALLSFHIPDDEKILNGTDHQVHEERIKLLVVGLLCKKVWPVFQNNPLVLDNYWDAKSQRFTPYKYFNLKVALKVLRTRDGVLVTPLLETFSAPFTFKLWNHTRRYRTLSMQRRQQLTKALEGFEEEACARVKKYFSNIKEIQGV